MAVKTSTPKRKEARARSYVSGQERKALNRDIQEMQAKDNKATRAAGGATPWEQDKAKRAEKRLKLQTTE